MEAIITKPTYEEISQRLKDKSIKEVMEILGNPSKSYHKNKDLIFNYDNALYSPYSLKEQELFIIFTNGKVIDIRD
jgi:hypothetical protein